MAVHCEFIDFIIPIKNINKVYAGGFAKFKEDNREGFSSKLWHDNSLLRDGAMSPSGIEALIQKWEDLGLIGIEVRNGRKYWKDFCVVEGHFGGPTLDCDWIEYDKKANCAHLNGEK